MSACDNATLYELDQMSEYYKDSLCEFIGFLKIQDDSSLMYSSGMKLVELCKMTHSMRNIEEEADRKTEEIRQT